MLAYMGLFFCGYSGIQRMPVIEMKHSGIEVALGRAAARRRRISALPDQASDLAKLFFMFILAW